MTLTERIRSILDSAWETSGIEVIAPQLTAIIARYVDRPAKLLRPRLLIAAAQAYAGSRLESAHRKQFLEGVHTLAAGTELLHIFALLHDDALDQDGREGVAPPPPVSDQRADLTHRQILAGDLLHSVANETISSAVNNYAFPREIISVIHGIAQMTVAGQYLDIRFPESAQRTRENLFRMYDLKTGYYSFVAPLRVGALCAGGAAGFVDQPILTELGLTAGRAFQLQDDLRDVQTAGAGVPAAHQERHPWEFNMANVFAPPGTSDSQAIPQAGPEYVSNLRERVEPVLRELRDRVNRLGQRLSLEPDRRNELETILEEEVLWHEEKRSRSSAR